MKKLIIALFFVVVSNNVFANSYEDSNRDMVNNANQRRIAEEQMAQQERIAHEQRRIQEEQLRLMQEQQSRNRY